jgi:hypothetical protein
VGVLDRYLSLVSKAIAVFCVKKGRDQATPLVIVPPDERVRGQDTLVYHHVAHIDPMPFDGRLEKVYVKLRM